MTAPATSPAAGAPLERRLAAGLDRTPAERAVAGWLAAHPRRLPFETAAGIAAGAGVSEMSVLRFLRRLGYANLRALKDELASHQGEVGPALDDRWQRFRVPAGTDEAMAESLRAEIAALVQVYELATRPVWGEALDAIVRAERVHVAGFQASKGLALDFATRLKYARPGVRFAEGTSGAYSEIFAEDDGPACTVLVDTAAYARTAFRLAARCAEEGVPLVIVTDRFGDWGRAFTPMVLAASTQIGTFWDTPSPIAALLNLLLNAVTAARGAEATRARLARLHALGEHFEAFGYEPEARGANGRGGRGDS